MPPDAPKDDLTPAPARAVPRLRIAFNVVAQILLLFFIAIVANYLSCRHHRQWDLTLNRKFTLSTTTSNFLASLDQEVTIIVAFLSRAPIYPDVKGLLDQYLLAGNSRIKVEFIDPARNPARAADLKTKFNLALDQNAIIIATGDRVRVVPEDRLVTTDTGGRVVEFRGEAVLTSALIEAVEKDKKKLYLVSGHRNVPDLQVLLRDIHGMVSKQNAEVHELFFARAESIPADCAALLLLGPQVDLTSREIDMLRDYWENEKGNLFLLLDPSAATPNLTAFVRTYGVVPQNDRVLLVTGVPGLAVQKTYDVPALFLTGPAIARDLVGLSTQFPVQSQSLKVYENDPILHEEGVSLTPLVVADSRFWGETAFEKEELAFSEKEDNVQPLYLAASIEKGAVDDPRLRIKSSRMVVVGNARLLDSSPRRIGQNHDFFMSSINWMLDREELIGIAPKVRRDYSLSLNPGQKSRIQLIVLVLMPAGAFLLAFTVWSARRH